MLGNGIDIHEVESISLTDGTFLIGKSEHLAILQGKILLLCCAPFLMRCGRLAASWLRGNERVVGMRQGRGRPIVEDGRSAIYPTESLFVHSLFSKLLSAIDHKRILLEEKTHSCGRQRLTCITTEEIAGNTLLVMIFQKIEHMLTYIVDHLPFVGDTGSRTFSTDYSTQTVIHTHLVIEVIKTCLHVVAILVGIVHLSYDNHFRVTGFQYLSGIRPEGARHHLSHVTTESVDTLACPEQQDVSHLAPGTGHRLIVIAAAAGITIIHSIVEFHRLIPVVSTRMVVKAVVACCLGRTLMIGFVYLGFFGRESLELGFGATNIVQVQITPSIIEIIARREVHVLVIIFSKISYTCWFANGMILTSHMIGHKVHDDLHTSLVSALDKTLPFRHSHADILCQIRIDVIIVGNGIR